MNEGHAAFINVQRLIDYIKEEGLIVQRSVGGGTLLHVIYRSHPVPRA